MRHAVVDLQGIYPAHLVPTFMSNIIKFYMEQYNDLFFVNHPPFFTAFMWSEALYQIPVGIWAIPNLLNGLSLLKHVFRELELAETFLGTPKVPLVLLPFSVVIFLTTGTCIWDYMTWDVPLQQKFDLTTLYGPYLLLCMLHTPSALAFKNKS
jgi:hypothetical protein